MAEASTVSLLRLCDVEARAGIKRTQIYQLIKAEKFPRPVQLGPRCVRWPSSEVQEWIAARIKECRGEHGLV